VTDPLMGLPFMDCGLNQTPGTLSGNQRGKLYGQFDCRAALWATANGPF
jgi:hypothetical protein